MLKKWGKLIKKLSFMGVLVLLSGCILTNPLGKIDDAIYDDDLAGLWVYVKKGYGTIYYHFGRKINSEGKTLMIHHQVEHRKDGLDSGSNDIYVTEISGEKFINAIKREGSGIYYSAGKYSINEDKTILTVCGVNQEKIKPFIVNGRIEGKINKRGMIIEISSKTEVLQQILIENKELNIFDNCKELKRVKTAVN